MSTSLDPSPSPPVRPDPVPLRPLEGRSGPAANLPRPLTSFIGREREIALVVDRLHRDHVRLLTLTGPGGVGKTRLAIGVAMEVTDDFPDGIWFVPLAPVRNPDLIASTIAQTLGVQETSERSIVESVAAFLAGRRVLLILDNFEHVLSAGPLLTDLLTASPALNVLVTSRTVLRLSGEHDLAVPPLSLESREVEQAGSRAEDDSLLDSSTSRLLASSEAVRLFVERATAADATFALTAGNASDVAALCAQLDGLPLAIELAAARTRSLSPRAMLQRLEQRLRLLTEGARDQPPRLRSMRDAIAWSYDLLAPEEQRLFRYLAVFTGEFTLTAAEAVAAPDGDLPVLDGIGALVEQSLLRQVPSATDEPRYQMLETLREFGFERLVTGGEDDDARRRHASYFLKRSDDQTRGVPLLVNLDHRTPVATEYDNVRLALAWFGERDESEALLRLSVSLAGFWLARGLYREGLLWLERALARSDTTSRPHVEALIAAGALMAFQGDFARAELFLRQGLALARGRHDPILIGEALTWFGVLSFRWGQYGRAEEQLNEAYPLLCNILDRTHGASPPLALGDTALSQEQFATAARRYKEAIGYAAAAGYAWGLSDAQAGLGGVYVCLGDLGRAAALYAESLDRAHRLGFTHVAASSLLGLAAIAAKSRRAEEGAYLLGAVEGIAANLGAPMFPRDRPIHDRTLPALSMALGEERLNASLQAGRSLTIEQAVAAAKRDLASAMPDLTASPPDPTHGTGLTPRELDVLRLVAAGYSNAQIAEVLFISVPTVKRHLTNILGKLGLPSRSAATAYAHTHGLA